MAKSTVAFAAGSFLLVSLTVLASCGASHDGFNGDGGPGSVDDSGPPGNVLPDGTVGTIGGGNGNGEGGGLFGSSSGGSDAGSTSPVTCQTLTRLCSTACSDFPLQPVIDTATPMNAATYFTAADGAGAGPCIVDPTPGTLIPQNWLRPRFQVVPTTGQNLFEITLTSTRQANPYIIYTSNTTWTMPKTVWDALRGDSWGDTVDVKVRGVNTAGGAPASTTGSFTIAPALAGGSMIYWAAVGDIAGMSWLEGFAPGDESVATTLTTGQVQLQQFRNGTGALVNGGAVQCIGCHAAVPDGNSVTFLDNYPWPGAVASVAPVAGSDGGFTEGQTPGWLTPGGSLALGMPWLGATTFSKADWANEKVVVTSFGCGSTLNGSAGFPYLQTPCQGGGDVGQPGALMWIDLAAGGVGPEANDTEATIEQKWLTAYGTSWGYIPRTGDPNFVEFPSWSHDGTTVVYVSNNVGQDGRLAGTANSMPPAGGVADLYSVPFNGKMGGAASPVPGASDPKAVEYYPAFSADDKLLAFDRATQLGMAGIYYNSYGEVNIVPFGSATATPTRLAANDPPACLGVKSPGVTNSWPKWSPDVESCPDGNTYYWLVFSSTRAGIPFHAANLQNGVIGPTSQLYITGVRVGSGGTITTFPALYLWNQPSADSLVMPGTPQSNHTPIWETVTIPRPPPPVNQ